MGGFDVAPSPSYRRKPPPKGEVKTSGPHLPRAGETIGAHRRHAGRGSGRRQDRADVPTRAFVRLASLARVVGALGAGHGRRWQGGSDGVGEPGPLAGRAIFSSSRPAGTAGAPARLFRGEVRPQRGRAPPCVGPDTPIVCVETLMCAASRARSGCPSACVAGRPPSAARSAACRRSPREPRRRAEGGAVGPRAAGRRASGPRALRAARESAEPPRASRSGEPRPVTSPPGPSRSRLTSSDHGPAPASASSLRERLGPRDACNKREVSRASLDEGSASELMAQPLSEGGSGWKTKMTFVTTTRRG